MKILLVHQNFPGQFKHLAQALIDRGHEVVALTDAGNQQKTPVRTFFYPAPPTPPGPEAGYARTYTEMANRADKVARAARSIRAKEGFEPDLILAHSGWGETLFLKEVWPDVRLIVYAELHYRSTGQDVAFDPEFGKPSLERGMNVVARGAHQLQAVALADAALAPTRWQAETFPEVLQPRISIIHEGVDTGAVRPDPRAALALPGGPTLRAGDEVLSFLNRNLEPYRGYHIFMRALPEVLRRRPDAQVVIVGGNSASYGPKAPEGLSWKQIYLDEVADQLDMARVHFVPRLSYPHFLKLMQLTRVHAYLTYPFVLSWSMLEAMSAGALVVGSDTAPVREVLRDGENGRLVDFFDIPGWEDALTDALARPEAYGAMRKAARETIINEYDLKTRCLPQILALIEQS